MKMNTTPSRGFGRTNYVVAALDPDACLFLTAPVTGGFDGIVPLCAR